MGGAGSTCTYDGAAGLVAPPPVVVDYGQPHKTLDRAAWVVGLPGRVLTLNWETNNHRVSPQTVDKLRDYLEENDLTDVYVAVNTYDPKGQWRRLRENDRISPFWRYSVGALGWVKYTVMPYRVATRASYLCGGMAQVRYYLRKRNAQNLHPMAS